MSDRSELIDTYIAAWNETDAERRRALIAAAWAKGAHYLDPVLQGEGHDGIDAMIAQVQARFPGHRFRRTGAVDAHHDCVRFTWELGPEGGPAAVRGTDFAQIDADARLRSVTGFFDQAPGAAG